MGTSHTAVGLILVSALVSLPEILVALIAAFLGHPVISIGVVIGSIICNIGLMSGVTAVRNPIKVDRSSIVRDGVFSVVFAVVVMALAFDGVITRFEGLALFLLFLPYIITVWEDEKLKGLESREKDFETAMVEMNMIGMQFGKLRAGPATFVLGAALLLFGSRLFSTSLVDLARISGLSDLIIGLTFGAIGPSIPNITAAWSANARKMDGVVIGETLGSNIFTLLVTLGVLSLVAPLTISPSWIAFDIPAMVIMSFVFLFFMIHRRELTRVEGALLLALYAFILGMQIVRYA
jgi:cation:H+ antiporter